MSSNPTLTLHIFDKPKTEPGYSAFCLKLEAYLRAAGASYRTVSTLPSSGPKGKLPYITLSDNPSFKMGDSHFIIQHLVQTGQVKDIDEEAGLSTDPVRCAHVKAWIAYVDEKATPAVGALRWAYPSGWRHLKKELFGPIPWPLNECVAWYFRNITIKGLRGNGVARHNEQEVNAIVSEFLSHLSSLLRVQGTPYLFGNKPTSADASTYGLLGTTLATESNDFARSAVLRDEVLRQYVIRLTELWFPEYQRILKMLY